MLDNPNVAAQERYNNRSFLSFQPRVDENTAALPVVPYRVFTLDGRMMVFNDSSEASLHRYLKYIGIKYNKVQLETEYQDEQTKISEAVRLANTARTVRAVRGLGRRTGA